MRSSTDSPLTDVDHVETKSDRSILFLGKEADAHCARAADFLAANFDDVCVLLGRWGDPLPGRARDWNGDFIVSYLSRWVVPESLLGQAKVAAINFHPASPDYPGIGCNNFALYENAEEYGVTCHHMASTVDTGGIIAVKRFAIYPNDDVRSLLMRTYDFQLVLFYEVMEKILRGEPLPVSEETWTRKPFSRKEFNELGKIDSTMTAEEIARRVRAISYGTFQPTVEVGGYVFKLNTDDNG